MLLLSFIDLERGGFGEILPDVIILFRRIPQIVPARKGAYLAAISTPSNVGFSANIGV
jgi:hypothetical protein